LNFLKKLLTPDTLTKHYKTHVSKRSNSPGSTEADSAQGTVDFETIYFILTNGDHDSVHYFGYRWFTFRKCEGREGIEALRLFTMSQILQRQRYLTYSFHIFIGIAYFIIKD